MSELRRRMMSANKGRLPNGYQELKWIEGDGNTYLEYNPIQSVSRFILRTGFTRKGEKNGWNIIARYSFGSVTYRGNTPYDSRLSGHTLVNYYTHTSPNNGVVVLENSYRDYEYSLIDNYITFKVNGVQVNRWINRYGATNAICYALRDCVGILTYIDVIDPDTGEKTMEMIPALEKSSGRAGMYDIKNNLFHGSVNQYDFIHGPYV